MQVMETKNALNDKANVDKMAQVRKAIEANINAVDDVLEYPVDLNDVEGINEKLIAIQSVLPLIPSTLSQTKLLLDYATGQTLFNLNKEYKAHELRAIIAYKVREEQELHTRADRMYSVCKQVIEILRTTISRIKEEKKLMQGL